MNFFSVKTLGVAAIVIMVAYGFMRESYDWHVRFSPASPEKIVAFGDSLTYGYGVKRSEAYPAILSKSLGHEITNLGQNGLTTVDAVLNLQKVLDEDPTVVIMTLTGNDIIRQLPVNMTVDSLRKIFEQLQSREILIVYVAIDPPFMRQERLDKVRDLCREFGVLYVPHALSSLWQNQQFMIDQIHPNSAGYNLMAEKIFKRIKPHLK